MSVAVRVENLSKWYFQGATRIDVLNDVSFSVEQGEIVSIVGPSGCGKSTLLHLLGMLDRPSSGNIFLDKRNVARLPDGKLHRIRNREIGFVFQAHHLFPEHDALGNVLIPMRLAGTPMSVAKHRALRLLDAVGLSKRVRHRPGELSGGEQQRVALARALVMGPRLVLADEPTGNLDPNTANDVFELMLNLNKELGSTLLVVTHSHAIAERFPRTLVFDEGGFIEKN